MFIKSAAGLKIRDPISRVHLADDGEQKPDSTFWVRRLRCGDVVECTPLAPPAANVVDTNSQIPDSASKLEESAK